MPVHERREIEVKFCIGSDVDALGPYRNLLQDSGYYLGERRLEIDFLPDTEDGLCKKHGLLLRIRQIRTNHQNSWLLTLKVRSRDPRFLDFHEIETTFDDPDSSTFRHINKILLEKTGHELDDSLLRLTHLGKITQNVQAAGFTTVRILLEKYREEYAARNLHITLDYFPEKMGAYLEIEGHTTSAVTHAYKELKLREEAVITTDYGDLLKLHKRAYAPEEQRKSLFSAKERHALLGLKGV